jgi:hypothetical protein
MPTASAPTPTATAAPRPPLAVLPGGGRVILPRYRVVAYYGNPKVPALGVLGRSAPDQAAARLMRAARPFVAAGGKPVLPALELIATVANGFATPEGDFSTASAQPDIGRFLTVARRHKALLVLDIQPGRADFLTAARYYERWLRQPDVGLALDPEWSMRSGQVPGERIGSTDAATVNRVSAYLAALVARYRLPQKLFVVHEFRLTMVTRRERVVARPGLATVFHIDGFGGQRIKRQVYAALHAGPGFYNGFKLFYRQDTGLMTPTQVMALRPRPDLISYQ